MDKPKGARTRLEKRKRAGLSLDMPLRLVDGRLLIVRKGEGKLMVCRQKAKTRDEKPLQVGEQVLAPMQGDQAVLLEVIAWKGKNVHLRIVGKGELDADTDG